MSRFRKSLYAAAAVAIILADSAAVVRGAGRSTVREIELPPETAKLRVSTLPGYQLALQKCGICHSADYIAYQPPHMTLVQWTAEVAKMQHAYGAPLEDAQIAPIAEYLASSYGDAT